MISCKRAKFSLPENVAYLNCAYMAPLLKSVEKAGIRGLRKKRNPSSILPADFFLESEQLRVEFSNLINSPESNRIVIVPSVSYGMATVSANLAIEHGKEIVVAAEQFPSNYYSWKSACDSRGGSLRIVSPPEGHENRGKIWNERILDAINKNTVAVAIAHYHWADGTRFDLEAIRSRTLDVGARLIVDGTQSVGAAPFDVQKIKPDALVCAGYKWLLGPYSIGLAYYGEAFDNGTPIEENWINRRDSEDFAGLVNYQDQYHEGALRYEVGEHSNFILVPMLLKAVTQLNRWKPELIEEYCRTITISHLHRLKEAGYIIDDDQWRGNHLFGIRVPAERDITVIKQKLLEKKIIVSYRGNAIRVSPNIYNRDEEISKLVNILCSC